MFMPFLVPEGQDVTCSGQKRRHCDRIGYDLLSTLKIKGGGRFLYLQLELAWLQLIFFSCSLCRCFLNELSHRKNKNFNCKQVQAPSVSQKALQL